VPDGGGGPGVVSGAEGAAGEGKGRPVIEFLSEVLPFLQPLWCRLGGHRGRIDGGFRCDFCSFFEPFGR